MEQEGDEGWGLGAAVKEIVDLESAWRGFEAADVTGGAWQMGEAVVGAFEGEAIGRCCVGADGDVGAAASAERAEEVGLVRILKTERVVAGGGPSALAFFSGDILKDALIDDQALTADR